VAYILSFVLFYMGLTYWVFALAMIAFAFGDTFRSGTHKAMILEHLRICGCEDHKVMYYGKTRAASQLGSALASLIAAGLVFWTGNYRIIFLASTVPYVLNLLLLASYPRVLDGEHISQDRLSWRMMGVQFAATLRLLVKLLKDPCTLRGLLSSASFGALFKSTKDYLQPIVQAHALALPLFLGFQGEQRTAILVGGVYSLIYLATSFASSHAGFVQSRLRSSAAGINLTLGAGIGLLIVGGAAAWMRLDTLASLAFVAVFVVQNLRRPMIVGYLADRMDHCAMASGLSVEAQLRTLFMAAMAPIVGWMADQLGVGAAIVVISLAVLLISPLFRLRRES